MACSLKSVLRTCLVAAVAVGLHLSSVTATATDSENKSENRSERGKPAPVIVIPDEDETPEGGSAPDSSSAGNSETPLRVRMGTTRELPVRAENPEPPPELPEGSDGAASPLRLNGSRNASASEGVREAAFNEPLQAGVPSGGLRLKGAMGETASDGTSLQISEGGSAVVPPSSVGASQDQNTRFEPASFNGVVAGETNEATLFEKWDQPLKTEKGEGGATHQFKVDPFKLVEAVVEKGTVVSVVIHLETPFAADLVTQQLELDDVNPVLVANELGDVLGQAFPERGVLFAFEPSLKKGRPSLLVRQIVLEPIGPESFLLRAETRKTSDFRGALADLDVVLSMNPGSARAHWLRSGLLSKVGRHEEALEAARSAVELENTNPRYRLSCAEALWRCENPTDALLECQAAADLAKDAPHVKAAVLLLMGDIHAEEPLSDYKKAIQFHMKAIEIAEPAAEDRHPAIRLAAKEVLVDAHLGAAIDVASGNWRNKDVAVAKWLAGAGSRNEDLIAEAGRAEEHRLHLAAVALRACAGAKDAVDPAPWGKSLIENAIALVKDREDPLYRLWVRRQAAGGMCDCLRVSHWRGETEQALSCGEAAWEWLAEEFQRPEATDADRLLLGRMCFMTGSIHALVRESHEEAVPWFDKAAPLLLENPALERGPDRAWAADCLVSMGVSYWQTGNREKAVEVTAAGGSLLESLVREGLAEAAKLSVPYGNLAAMHGELGETQKAELFAQKSKDAEKGPVRTATPAAGQTLLR